MQDDHVEDSKPNMLRKLACPVCNRRFLLDETDSPPFCSTRCKMIDLGRWLGEEYGLPYEGDPGDEPRDFYDESSSR